MKDWFIKKLGGYTKADRHEMLTELVKDLYNTVTEKDIFRIQKNGQWTYMGKLLPPEHVQALANEAKVLETSKVWKMLQTELQHQANLKMFVKSSEIIHLESGKLLLYYVKVVNDKLKEIGSLSNS